MSFKNILCIIFILSILCSFTFEINLNSVIDYFKSFLQKNVANSLLLNAVTLLRKLPTREYPDHLENNIQNFPKHLVSIKRNNGYIEDQHNYGDLKSGVETLSYNGCGIIATYNALNYLTGDENLSLPEIIDYFEKNNGLLLYGLFGVAPQAIEEYMNGLGFQTMSSPNKEEYLAIQEACDVYILTKFNDINDITKAMHHACINKKPNGKFQIHNNGGYNGYLKEYDSISDILSKIDSGNAKDIVLIGIKNK